MVINQTLSFESENYIITLNVPTLNNCQALVDYCRPLFIDTIKKNGSDVSELADLAFLTFDDLKQRYDILRPFIKELLAADGTPVNFECPNMQVLNFIAFVLPVFYREVFEQSEIKKK